MLAASLTLPADVHAARGVRAMLGGLLERLDVPAELRDDVLLAVTEAVTNACRHAYPDGGGSVEVAVETGAALVVRVTDHGTGTDGAVSDDPGAGYGLLLMRSLSECRMSETPGGGTTVHLSVQLDEQP